MSGTAAIELRAIGKRYGAMWAVRGADVAVTPGEFLTLLGPSGCGKTTVLRMIAGFAEPDEGEIRLDGRSVAGVPPWRRDLGLVFQNYALWPHLDVFEHVAFGLRERGVSRAERRRRVAETLAMVGLEGLEARRPSELSGGQQQRVALARTLVTEPRALLLDEPLSNLDAQLRAQMRVELRRLQRGLGITTVYVTHDQDEAMALSSRIAVFDRGALVQLGTPVEIYRAPRSRFVAEFLGAANLLPGVLEGGGGRVRLDGGLRLAVEAGGAAGAPVLCVIRPESVRFPSAGGAHANRFEARVASAVYVGGRWDCELALPGSLTVRAELPSGGGLRAPEPGAALAVAIAPEDIVVIAA